jgi:stage III sporulation protein AB
MSYRYSDAQKKRLKNLDSLIDLVRYIRTQIDCFMLPVDKIILDYTAGDNSSSDIASELKKDSFAKSAEKLKDIIGGEEYEAIASLSKSLGKGYRDEQLKLCGICLDSLESIYQKHKSDMQGKIKTYRAFCLLGSIMIIILFLERP